MECAIFATDEIEHFNFSNVNKMKDSKQIFERGLLSCMVAALAIGFAVAQENQEETVDPVINDYSTLFEDAELTRAIFKQASTDPLCPWAFFKSRMNYTNGFGLTDGTGSYGETVADGFSSNADKVWLKDNGTFASGKPGNIYYSTTITYYCCPIKKMGNFVAFVRKYLYFCKIMRYRRTSVQS